MILLAIAAIRWRLDRNIEDSHRGDNDFQNALTFSTIVARTYQGDAEGNGLFLRGFEGKHGRISDGDERAETDGVFSAVVTRAKVAT